MSDSSGSKVIASVYTADKSTGEKRYYHAFEQGDPIGEAIRRFKSFKVHAPETGNSSSLYTNIRNWVEKDHKALKLVWLAHLPNPERKNFIATEEVEYEVTKHPEKLTIYLRSYQDYRTDKGLTKDKHDD